MKTEKEIYEQLTYLKTKDRAITLVTEYKGVTFSVIAKINAVDQNQGEVQIGTHPSQEMSLLSSSVVELFSDLFPRPMQARVRSVDAANRSAVLDRIDYVFETLGNRKEQRVQPAERVKVNIHNRISEVVVGSLINISPQGLSIKIINSGNFLEDFQVGDSTRIEFALPLEDTEGESLISMMAKFIYINPLEEISEYQVGLRTWPGEREKALIRQYVFDRQTQLVKEISKSG